MLGLLALKLLAGEKSVFLLDIQFHPGDITRRPSVHDVHQLDS